MPTRPRRPLAKRHSKIHGTGVFATKRIRPGRTLLAYVGEILTEAEVDARYTGDAAEDPHTFLFGCGKGRYVDASVGGNDARFINHSCDPNCETELSDGVIWISAIRNIQPGAELTYDYCLEIERDASRSRRSRYACRCGAARCRGTMLAGPPRRAGRNLKARRGGGRRSW